MRATTCDNRRHVPTPLPERRPGIRRNLLPFSLVLLLLAGCATQVADKPARPPAEQSVERAEREGRPPVAAQSDTETKKPVAAFDTPEGMIAEAKGLVEKNQFDAALLLFRRAIQEFGHLPQANEARFRLGETLLLQDQIEQALPTLVDASVRSGEPFAWESLSLVGDIQARQGDLPGAWTSWVRVAHAPTPLASATWQRFLKSYLQYGNAETTQRLFQGWPSGPLAPDLARMALASIDQLETGRLEQLHAVQPPTSPLTPMFALILGDRHHQEGGASGTQGAQSFWQSARSSDLTSQEAQRRLAPSDSQSELVLGLLLPLTGDKAGTGKNLLKSAKKALRDYPDTRIVLRVADSHGKADPARQAIEQFRADGVGAIIGPVFHEEAKAAAEVAARYNIPIITLNPRSGIVIPGSSVLQNAFRPESEGQYMARFAIEEKKLRRFAILAPDTEYGNLLTQAFSDEVQKLGGTIARATFFPSGTRDFSPWIKALINADPGDKEATLKSAADFDALFVPANAQDVRLILPQAAFFKVRQPEVTFLGTSLWNKPELFREGTDFLRGAYFCDTDDVARNRFASSFLQTWKETPTPLDMLAYDSIALVAQALREARMSGQPWTAILKGGQRVYGAAGVVFFDDKGQSRRDYFFYRIDADGPRKTELVARQDPVASPPPSVVTPAVQPGAPPLPGPGYF
ncbi:MAG: penicillin-binding protein activator [Magnetococcales bacterium]|nr:penicillin-binding protein activator [Magnetococcales bacterium]